MADARKSLAVEMFARSWTLDAQEQLPSVDLS